MKKFFFLFSLLMSLTISTNLAWGATVTDVLNRATTGITGTSYSSWSGKTATSDAVYAGNSAGGNSSIQLRSSNSNSGIITTKSGGKVKSITVEWNSNSANGRTIDIYGKNSAYSAATDLYNNSNQGTKLGSIVYGTSTSLTVSGDYEYVGIRSNSGALYLTSVTVVWDKGSDVTVKTLKSIDVSEMSTTYEVGDAFAFDGTCTATYSVTKNGVAQPDQSETVTSISTSSPNMASEGEKTVTVSYTEEGVTKQATYNITVIAAYPKITITDAAIESFTTSYAEYSWANNNVSGKLYAYKQSGIQFNSAKDGSYVYNENAIPGNIRRIKIITTSGKTSQNWTPYVSTTAMTEADANKALDTKASSETGTSWWLTGDNRYFYLVESGGATNISSIVISYEVVASSAVATPTISGTDNFLNSTQVTITCNTTGATIYYTTDGSTPTSSTMAYSSPFTLTNSAKVQAIAIKSGMDDSEVATKEFTKVTPLTTMDAIFGAATSTATNKYITFNSNWVISGISTNGKQAYLTDGTKGLILFNNTASTESPIGGLAVGNTLSGTIECSLVLYNGAAEIQNFSVEGLTKGSGGSITPVELDATGIETLSGVNTGSVIKISGECTVNNEKYYIAGVQLYNTLFSFTNPNEGSNYNCTGVYTQFYTTKEILPRSAADLEEIIIAEAPENPTFSLAAGTYTEVKSVTISCATEGATIYYTTNGNTPSSESTEYTEAISVGETMTIKAIAIKDGLSSAVATATYTINLPVDVETTQEWDLSVDQTATASEDELTWVATYVDMSVAKGTSATNANNYYPGTSGYTHTRIYKNSVLTITPKGDKKITKIYIITTGKTYADALISSTWTNAVAAANSSNTSIVEVTPTKTGAISATIGGASRLTKVQVEYQSVPRVPVTGVTLDQSAVMLKAGRSTTLVATVTPDDANNQNVTWSTSNEAIATVEDGVVSAEAVGNATITATTVDGKFTATCVVTVVDASTRFADLAVFKKVTGTITDGQYLIVFEGDGTNGPVAFDAALETLDAAGNVIDITIEDDLIIVAEDAAFTIDATAGTIKSYSGLYIGQTSDANGLVSNATTAYVNTMSIADGNFVAVSGGAYLRYNSTSNANRFRYYKSGTYTAQQAIQLYKKVEPTSIRGDLAAGKWGTICPQKKVLVPQGASFYTLTYKEVRDGAPYKVFFDEIGEGESLIAGKPYLFIAEGTDILGVETGDAATSAQNYNGFYGIVGNSAYTLSVSQVESDAYTYYIIYQNQIRRCGVGDFTMAVGRAYINMEELSDKVVAPAPGRRRVGMENPEAPQHYTGIDTTMSNGKAVKMIIGEQLFILRDGKLYDTTGRFITNMQ